MESDGVNDSQNVNQPIRFWSLRIFFVFALIFCRAKKSENAPCLLKVLWACDRVYTAFSQILFHHIGLPLRLVAPPVERSVKVFSTALAMT